MSLGFKNLIIPRCHPSQIYIPYVWKKCLEKNNYFQVLFGLYEWGRYEYKNIFKFLDLGNTYEII